MSSSWFPCFIATQTRFLFCPILAERQHVFGGGGRGEEAGGGGGTVVEREQQEPTSQKHLRRRRRRRRRRRHQIYGAEDLKCSDLKPVTVSWCIMGINDIDHNFQKEDNIKPDVLDTEIKTGSLNHSSVCSSSQTETSQKENSLCLDSASLDKAGGGGGGGGDRSRAASCDDDEEGHLVYRVGLVMNNRYEVVSSLGAGAFGKVVKCMDREKDEHVAVKIVKNIDCFREVAMSEIAVLEEIKSLDDDHRFACVRMLDWFEHEGHVCIVFELLGISTFEFLRQKRFLPFTVEQIRHMAFQIFRAVCFLHRNKLTHTDLKPENILLVNQDCDSSSSEETNLQSLDVKVVDFGTATFDHQHHESLVSTRHYRAPEVILDLGWNQSCDVWSLGCVLMEFYLGHTLFPTHDSKEHLAMMEKVLGPIPGHMLKQTRKKHYIHNDRLHWDEQSSSDSYVRKHCKPLKQIMPRVREEERQLFDLVSCMLEYDVCSRITLEEALWHPFFGPVRAQTHQRS
ncbi:dual specificity protein kinase CLK4-like isoform X3 [Cynoglossus semilaevis]|uniref:dual specificity protein kinase CLK4-like isoform X3 n=1 Tax=Cynoglossus semilaevis TaxID=244447 RepID=UPI000D62A2A2|nr:dual specificity protein kinase CLK4-like isoform X3 [Cynoglossus semilaevis]